MTKQLFILLLVLVPGLSRAQRVSGPVWASSHVSFEMAKIRIKDDKGVYGPEKFKTSTISIASADYDNPDITIDIPDMYFLKGADVVNVGYNRDPDNQMHITYSLMKERVHKYCFPGNELN